MALIAPLRAVRPLKKYVKEVASYPYDVISSQEARKIADVNPYSFLHISKAEVDLPEGTDPHDERVYEKARENFDGFIKSGIFIQDPLPFFYLYRLKTDHHEQCGIVAGVHLSEFESGRVKQHESVLPDKVVDRTRHIEKVNAQTGPIFMTYLARRSIDRLVAGIVKDEPEYDFTCGDGITHTVWVIRDRTTIAAVQDEFKKIESLYIADGHHRAASAVAVARKRREKERRYSGKEEYNYVMSVLFPHDQLKIMDYNRAVKDLNGLSREEFLCRVGVKFRITPDFSAKSPGKCHQFGMYLKGTWYLLEAGRDCYDPDDIMSLLDVTILQKHLLDPVLGIRDPGNDKRVVFVGGIRGMEELERLVDWEAFAVAFSLFPPTLEQMIAVADAGKIMPPKSTWFEPKLRSGIWIHLLD
ncbi:MAG: DUF1015 domain-containing protein [Syntrophales bacterium]